MLVGSSKLPTEFEITTKSTGLFQIQCTRTTISSKQLDTKSIRRSFLAPFSHVLVVVLNFFRASNIHISFNSIMYKIFILMTNFNELIKFITIV
jgi:hypothetical protein